MFKVNCYVWEDDEGVEIEYVEEELNDVRWFEIRNRFNMYDVRRDEGCGGNVVY